MGNFLDIGNAEFKSIIRSNYVDKTGLAAYINSTIGTINMLTCVSRPRRFGKSFAAKMLCAYYDRSCDSRDLFRGLAIEQAPDFEKHLNKYPVICLDMTWFIAKERDSNETRNVLEILRDEVIEELQQTYPLAERKNTLQDMLLAAADASGDRFIVIIDEWDALLREAQKNKQLHDDYISLLRALFKSSLTGKMIAAAYLTGILPIKKYGTQSAMTDFIEYSMLNPEPLEEYIGFTEDEVQELCRDSGLDFEQLRQWYNGYQAGKSLHIYNPKSVMEALRTRRIGSYWTQTDTYDSLMRYIDMDYEGLREDIMELMTGGSCPVNWTAFQNDMTDIRSKDDVFTLLIHLGYLTFDSRTRLARIPNEEVKGEFCNALRNGKRRELMRIIQNSDYLLEDTIAMDSEAVAAAIERVHNTDTASDYYNNEQALRSVVRFAYISCVDEYRQIQELPGGRGYADIVFLPKKHSQLPALVVELKWNRRASSAIAQIKERNYPAVLEGLTEDILLVGISYDAKTGEHSCQIERYEMV